MSVQSMTELEAVNLMLSGIGESPVSSLSSQSVHVATAVNILAAVSKEVQSRGLHFNTEDEYPLTPDAETGFITLPTNTARFTLTPGAVGNPTGDEIVQRDSRLYNKTDHTFVFTDTLKATMVFLFEFTELPDWVRQHVAARAKRIFQEDVIGSSTLSQFHRQAEAETGAHMGQADAEGAEYNALRAPGVFSIIAR